MKNKQGQQQPDNGMWKVWLFILAFIFAGILIYLFGKVAIGLGVIGILIGFIFMLIAAQTGEDEWGFLGIKILIFSIILFVLGLIIVNFFESNHMGILWNSAGKTVINGTAEAYKNTGELFG
jgi:hypothetical protein